LFERERAKNVQEKWHTADTAGSRGVLMTRPPVPNGPKVYFIRCGDFIKIGFSEQTERRFKSLQTAAAAPLELLGTIHGERELELHRQFAHLRSHGEWFRAAPELLAFITAHADSMHATRGPGAKALRELQSLRNQYPPDSTLWHHADIWLQALRGYCHAPSEHRHKAVMGCAARFEKRRQEIRN
jgi:hypothetical protein